MSQARVAELGGEPAKSQDSGQLNELPDASANGVTSAIEEIVFRVHDASSCEASGDLISSAVQICRGPGVEVTGVGLLPLPVNDLVFSAFQQVGGCATPADAVFVPASLRFENREWQGGRVPAPFITAALADVGIPAGMTCVASLRGLLVTGPGGSPAHRLCDHNEPGVYSFSE